MVRVLWPIVSALLRRALARARAREPRRFGLELVLVVFLLGLMFGLLVGDVAPPCTGRDSAGCYASDPQVRP